MLGLTYHIVVKDLVQPCEGICLHEDGGLSFSVVLAVDTMSLGRALGVARTKLPDDKSVLFHLLWLRDFLKLRILSGLSWADALEIDCRRSYKGQHCPGRFM